MSKSLRCLLVVFLAALEFAESALSTPISIPVKKSKESQEDLESLLGSTSSSQFSLFTQETDDFNGPSIPLICKTVVLEMRQAFELQNILLFPVFDVNRVYPDQCIWHTHERDVRSVMRLIYNLKTNRVLLERRAGYRGPETWVMQENDELFQRFLKDGYYFNDGIQTFEFKTPFYRDVMLTQQIQFVAAHTSLDFNPFQRSH